MIGSIGSGGDTSAILRQLRLQLLQQQHQQPQTTQIQPAGGSAGSGDAGSAGANGARGDGRTAALFARLDVDGDGSISKDDLENAFKQAGPAVQSVLIAAQGDASTNPDDALKQAADALFKAIDGNSDGSVDQSELRQALPGRDRGNVQSRVDDLMQHIDTDGSGTISKDELTAAAQQLGLGDQAASLADALFQKLDKDGSGQISRDELAQALRGARHGGHHHHHHADGDGDGGGGVAAAQNGRQASVFVVSIYVQSATVSIGQSASGASATA